MATAVHVKDVGSEDFQDSVVAQSWKRPVVVDFWAAWCGPCRMLGPILEKLADEFQGDFLLAKVDTEANPELAEHFQIQSIPNVKVFKDGKIADELMGAVPENQMRDFLRRHCPSAADRKYQAALEALQQGRTAEGRTALEEALRQDPEHAGRRVELGKILAAAGDIRGAETLWNGISPSSPFWDEAHGLKQSLQFEIVCQENGGPERCAARAAEMPEDLERRYAHACCLSSARDYRGALEELLAIVARDKDFQDRAARKAMLTIFRLAGERSALTEEYRKRLALVLF